MLKVGLREANLHFSKYVNLVRKGQEVVLTERGTPVAVIKPLTIEESPEGRIRLMEEQGLLRPLVAGRIQLPKLMALPGTPVSELVSQEREDRL